MQHPIGQHFLSGFDGVDVTPHVRDLILKEKILGFTLFKWNIESAEQLKALNEELQSLAKQAGYQLILAVDQEGGRVERLPEPFHKIPAMQLWAEKCCGNGGMQELGRLLGSEVRVAGFNLDFAPVVDVDSNPENPIIGDRSFSVDPKVVIECAIEVTKGLVAENVIPCLKHFPGHGATNKDSHLELPVDRRSKEDIFQIDLYPFQEMIRQNQAYTIMSAHVLYPDLDDKWPATLSETILRKILREQLHYQGVVFSDDLLMKAIADHYDFDFAARRFFENSGDVALICKEPEICRDVMKKIRSALNDPKSSLLKENLKNAEQRIRHLKELFFSNTPRDLSPLPQVLKKNQEFLNQIFSK